jgi:hypothetical protein
MGGRISALDGFPFSVFRSKKKLIKALILVGDN